MGASYVHRLHNQGKLSADTQEAIFDILVGYNQPGNNNNEAACAAAYEDVTGQDYPEGIAITNVHSGRKLYSNNDIGASDSVELEDNQKWFLEETDYNRETAYFIVNAYSGRRLYAQVDKIGTSGVGAGVGTKWDDQKWFIALEQNYEEVL